MPFYLAKIKLFDLDNTITLKALENAQEINSLDWRLKLAWIEYFNRTNQVEKANKLAKNTFKKYPEKAVIGMLYAKTLMKLGEYNTCLKFLEGFEVLPFEGATEGRTIYHETCIRLSINAFNKGDYSKAIDYAQKATLWPKNLGVGKHYDVDERLDNYLIAKSFEKLGNNKQSTEFFNKILNHKTPNYLNESSKLYLQLIVGKKFNSENLIHQLIEEYSVKVGNNTYIDWAIQKFNNSNTKKFEEEMFNSNIEIQVYDTKFVDVEFKLVTDVIRIINE